MSSIRAQFRTVCWFLAVLVGFGALLATSSVSAAEPSQQAFERVFKIQDNNADRVMAIKGVTGIGTGMDANGRIIIKIYTERPRVAGLPRAIGGVPVEVAVSGPIVARRPPALQARAVDPTQRFARPVPTGVSTGHPDITAGTISCRVRDGSGNVFALSNNHVYADENQATIGDNVLQPGTYDGGVDPADAIGMLFDFEPISFSPFARNKIDAAIAMSSTELLTNSTPTDGGYGTPSSTIVRFARPGLEVMKYGRTTELTVGVVDSVHASVAVGYSTGTARFVRQIIVTPGGFSAGGDSGSLVVTSDGSNPVGLLFAGSSSQTICNPIQAVLSRFSVTVDGT